MSGVLYTNPGAAFIAITDGWPTGLVGSIKVEILDLSGGVIQGFVTTNITEVRTGTYEWACPAGPATQGTFLLHFEDGGTPAFTTDDQELIVTSSVPTALSAGTSHGSAPSPGEIAKAAVDWARQLPDLCTIKRPGSGRDIYGGVIDGLSTIATAVPCSIASIVTPDNEETVAAGEAVRHLTHAVISLSDTASPQIGDTLIVTTQGSRSWLVLAVTPSEAYSLGTQCYTKEIA